MPRFLRAAVCSPLTAASEVGLAVLRDGGNAVDAAIATNLALAVAYPHMCGLGGDVLAMVWRDGEVAGLNSSGALPLAAALAPGEPVPERGARSATVPGAVAGWKALADRFGTMPLRSLAQPAIGMARRGVARAPGLVRTTRMARGILERDPEAARIFLADGPLVQADLAATLEEIDGFYEGPVAANAPAPFAPQDFAAHRTEWVEPMRAPFAGAEVCEMPPNSRGPIALEAFRRLEPLEGLAPEQPEWHARILRALRAATQGGDTIYLCVVDPDGMAVSLNQSLYMGFGSGVVVPGTGVLLHNRGAYHTRASYRGGARPVHTLAPALALDGGGRPRVVFGTMGGEAQVQIHVQVLARILLAAQDAQSAVAAPRFTLGHDGVLAESGLPAIDGLEGVPPVAPMPIPDLAGHAHAIVRRPDGGLDAGCDPRADGVALGF